MIGSGHSRRFGGLCRMSALPPIVLQKSPRRSCGIEIRNNRIGANEFLNRCCAFTLDLESILRARMRKIVLQHNPPNSDRRADIDLWSAKGHLQTSAGAELNWPHTHLRHPIRMRTSPADQPTPDDAT